MKGTDAMEQATNDACKQDRDGFCAARNIDIEALKEHAQNYAASVQLIQRMHPDLKLGDLLAACFVTGFEVGHMIAETDEDAEA
jgi:hypothetical protein